MPVTALRDCWVTTNQQYSSDVIGYIGVTEQLRVILAAAKIDEKIMYSFYQVRSPGLISTIPFSQIMFSYGIHHNKLGNGSLYNEVCPQALWRMCVYLIIYPFVGSAKGLRRYLHTAQNVSISLGTWINQITYLTLPYHRRPALQQRYFSIEAYFPTTPDLRNVF